MSKLAVAIVPFFVCALTSLATAVDRDLETDVPLSQAVDDFNRKWEAARQEIGEAELTSEEVLSALIHEHEEADLSDGSQQLVEKILKTKVLPPGTELMLWRRHFANKHMSYIWNISLTIYVDENSEPDSTDRQGPRRSQKVVIRKRYLASQPQGLELKSLHELLRTDSF